jgi:hypothetical protein
MDKHELSKQRIVSWLKDTSETQRLYCRISAKERIEAHIAMVQSLLDIVDAVTTDYN